MNRIETVSKRFVLVSTTVVTLIAPTFSSALPMRFDPNIHFNRHYFQPKALEKRSESQNETAASLEKKQTRLGFRARPLTRAQLFGKIEWRNPAAIREKMAQTTGPAPIWTQSDGTSLSAELIADFNRVRSMERPFDASSVIPLDMTPTNDSTQVFSKVADKSMSTFLNSPLVKESSLGQAADKVEKTMKKEVVLGDSSDPASVQHKLNFNLQAFQATAQVDYSGIANASLKYKIDESKLALEVSEKVSSAQDLIVSHSVSPADQVSQVSFRWNF